MLKGQPFVVQTQPGQLVARTLQSSNQTIRAGELPTVLVQRLQTLLPTPDRLLPLTRSAQGQAQLPSSGAPQPLPVPLPPKGDWALRRQAGNPALFQLVRLGVPVPLPSPLPQAPGTGPQAPGTAATTAAGLSANPSQAVATEPGAQLRPLENSASPLIQVLQRFLAPQMGQSGMTTLPLPSLAQLANPVLLSLMVQQLGRFPASVSVPPPLGPLAASWQRLLGVRPRNPGLADDDDLSALSGSERRQLLHQLAPMMKSLSDFQQQSQSDSEHPLLFLALPYGQESQQRTLQLSLQSMPADEKSHQKAWLLALRFELDPGALLVKARYFNQTLALDLTASNRAVKHKAETHQHALTERFAEMSMALNQWQCRVGTVPEELPKGQRILTYER
ncbi:hypothetical protein SAMN02745129_2833 [Ferrimonas marina]|uniref:Hook-length control protein FliK n=1 Tax=Ferrimonas marina TaxID=299255 RepID=A0A1M5VKR7_9GAMM|nr:hypothetical protein SAMN02745129_2833 [Ferrimonas marina]